MNANEPPQRANGDTHSCAANLITSERLTPTVAIVDDDVSAVRVASDVAQSLGLGVQTFATTAAFLAECDDRQPGCAVVEAKLAGPTGVELFEELSRRGASWPVIVGIACADTSLTVRAMRAGASEVLQKPYSESDLAPAIRKALDSDAATRKRSLPQREARERLQSLSAKEREVLDQIMSGRTTKEIARSLDVSLRTVELRRRAIFDKMQASQLATLVRIVLEARESSTS